MRAPVAELRGGFRHRVVQRRHAGRREVAEGAANLIVVGGERGLAANGSIERKERHFVSTRFHPTQQMLHDAFASLQVGSDAHAPARVEEESHADGSLLGGVEVDDRTRKAILEHLEVVSTQVLHQPIA